MSTLHTVAYLCSPYTPELRLRRTCSRVLPASNYLNNCIIQHGVLNDLMAIPVPLANCIASGMPVDATPFSEKEKACKHGPNGFQLFQLGSARLALVLNPHMDCRSHWPSLAENWCSWLDILWE